MTDDQITTGSPTAPASLRERLGPRGTDRAQPRFGVAIAAGGAALAILGAVAIGGDQLAPEGFDGSADKAPGSMIMLAALVGGYLLLVFGRRDSLKAAGATAAVIALPLFLFFITFNEQDLPPFSIDGVLALSTVGWGLGYMLGPSSGRPFFLGGALVGAWLFIIEQVESAFSAPFLLFSPGGFFTGPFTDSGDTPDLVTIGWISLFFGVGYLMAAGLLDRRDFQGAATPFAFVGLVVLANGFGGLAEDLEPAGTGVLVTIAGAVIALYGAREGRRGTTWTGGFGVAFGLILIVGDLFEDASATQGGIILLAVGGLVVVAATVLANLLNEPGEFEDIGRFTWSSRVSLRAERSIEPSPAPQSDLPTEPPAPS